MMNVLLALPSLDTSTRDTVGVMVAPEAESIDAVGISFRRGDDEALRLAYEAHGAAVHTYCAQTVGDAAADVTQEVFVAAWRHRERYDHERGPLVAWLIGIARFKVLDHLRKIKRVPTPLDTVPDVAALDAADRLAQELMVHAALAELPPQRRLLVEMAFFTDLTHHEIAQRTGIPIGSVKSDIRRGLLRLRSILEGHDVD